MVDALIHKHGANVEAVARKVYEVGVPTHTKMHLSGGADVDWDRVSAAILSLMTLIRIGSLSKEISSPATA